jgi:peptidoglycan/LPS O-acetylase OafA/YrhL
MTGVSIEPPPAGATDAGTIRGEFRPDLEGLRAVAVGLVLAYHVGLPLFGGGYVGVDVFFVLSGFLITGLIVREIRATGSLSLPSFYARRARRLLPAAALVLVVTMIAAWLVLPPLVVGDVGRDSAAAALYVANLRFALQATDYLAAEAAPSPVLHYWSLGVEEQFYLVWPALFLAATALAGRSLGRLALIVGVVGALSFTLSVVLTGVNAPWAFYSLPTRAWELALGALIALAAIGGVGLPRLVGAVLAAAGVALIVLAGAVLDTSTPFPGTAAVLPTLGAALVIAAGLGGGGGPVARWLSAEPVRFVGRISYSLYLWHWPILVIPTAVAGEELPLAARVGLGLLAVPLAALTQRWVEEPFRAGRLIGRRPRRNLALAGALTIAVAGTSLGFGQAATARLAEAGSGGVATRDLEDVIGTPAPVASLVPSDEPVPSARAFPVPSDLQPPLATAKEDLPSIYADRCIVAQAATDSPSCVYGDAEAATTVVLFGDSHAAQWFPTLDRLAAERGWRLVVLTKTLCAAVDHPVWHGRLNREYTECATWREAALERIAALAPDLVVVANSKFATLAVDGAPDPAGEGSRWDEALVRILRRLAGVSDRVALLGDTPQHGADPPVCLSAHLDDVLACATPRAEAVPFERLAADERVAETAGVEFIDPTAWTCPTDPCPVVLGNVLAFHDAGHMTRTFASALAPYLGAAIGELPESGN